MFKVYKVLIHLTSENDFKIARGTEEAFKKKKTPYKWSMGIRKGVQHHKNQENANQNYKEVLPHTCWNLSY